MPSTAPPHAPPTIRCRSRAGGVVGDPAPSEWAGVEAHPLSLWSGAPDPLAARRGASTARLLWDANALYLRGEIAFERLHLDERAPSDTKRHGLWDFDVVELFCSAGVATVPYGEVEGSPLGQWLDYWIVQPRVAVDRGWCSGARVKGAVGEPAEAWFTVDIALPWAGLGLAAPRGGTTLRGNVYAAQGVAHDRRFLALAPTGTAEPDFHVPERFAVLVLEDRE